MQDDDQDEDKEGGSDMAAYFGRMRIYFMCLAIVGAAPRQGAPGSPEDLGTDATDYIQVPWDLLLKYQARAEKAAGGAPLQSRMLAVTGLDVEERGQWAHRFATETTKTLGKIIKELMIEREALWVLGASGSRASAVPEPLPWDSNAAYGTSSTTHDMILPWTMSLVSNPVAYLGFHGYILWPLHIHFLQSKMLTIAMFSKYFKKDAHFKKTIKKGRSNIGFRVCHGNVRVCDDTVRV